MGKVITMEIPEHWLQGLDVEEAVFMQEVIQLGIYQLKVRRALEMYRAHAGSLGYIAEKFGLSKRELIGQRGSVALSLPSMSRLCARNWGNDLGCTCRQQRWPADGAG